jgi:hypothetical protein
MRFVNGTLARSSPYKDSCVLFIAQIIAEEWTQLSTKSDW